MTGIEQLGLIWATRPWFRFGMISVIILWTALVVFVAFIVWSIALKTKKKMEHYPEEAQVMIWEQKGDIKVLQIEIAYARAELRKVRSILKTVREAVNTNWPDEPVEVET